MRNFVESWERKPGRPRTVDLSTDIGTVLKSARFYGGGEIVDGPKEQRMVKRDPRDGQFMTKGTAKSNPKVEARKGR